MLSSHDIDQLIKIRTLITYFVESIDRDLLQTLQSEFLSDMQTRHGRS